MHAGTINGKQQTMIQGIFIAIAKGLAYLYRLFFPRTTVDKSLAYQSTLSETPKRIRVQFHNFTYAHFSIAAIWEFALGEEGLIGQDETTLAPCYELTIADPELSLYIVEAEFITPAGKGYKGFCSPVLQENMAHIAPCIFTPSGILSFYTGILEPERDLVDGVYQQLGESAESFFPLTFRALTPTKGIALHGTIEGFLWRHLEKEDILVVR